MLIVGVVMAYPNNTIFCSTHTDDSDYHIGTVIIQHKDMLCIGFVILLIPKKITMPWKRNSSPLLWFLKSSSPCLLAPNCSFTMITKISPLTPAMSYADNHLWKSMFPPLSIPLERQLSNTFSYLPHCDVANSSGGVCSYCPP